MTWREYEPENIQKGRGADHYHFTITKEEMQALRIVSDLVEEVRSHVYDFGELEDAADRLSELLEVFYSCSDNADN